MQVAHPQESSTRLDILVQAKEVGGIELLFDGDESPVGFAAEGVAHQVLTFTVTGEVKIASRLDLLEKSSHPKLDEAWRRLWQ
jgi:hypothetical protein